MDNVTLLVNQPYAVDDQLEMTLLFIIEEWIDNERRVEMDINILMKTPQIEEEIIFKSGDKHFAWRGYEFDYFGGGRKEVHLRVKRTGEVR